MQEPAFHTPPDVYSSLVHEHGYAKSSNPAVDVETITGGAMVPMREIEHLKDFLEYATAVGPSFFAYVSGKSFCYSRHPSLIPVGNPWKPDFHPSTVWNSGRKSTFEVGGDIGNVAFVYLAPLSFQEEDRWACLKILEKLPTAALPETIETLTELQEHYHALENPSIKRPTPPARHNVRARVLDTTG